MGVNQCEIMAAQIELHFPNESASVYFLRRPTKKSKGVLYDRYNNRISKLRSSSLLPKPKRFRRSKPVEGENSTDEFDLLSDNARILRENLMYNRDDMNLDDICAKWTASANYRTKWINSIKDANIDAIIKEWPAYCQTYGPRLIDIDFTCKYPEAESIFFKFDRFCNEVLAIMDIEIVEPLSKQMLKEYKQQKRVTPDARSSVMLLLLHAIIKPTTKKTTATNQTMKFTIKDAQNSFMVLLPSTQAVDQHIEKQIKMASNSRLKLQPFIFIIGDNLYSDNQYFIYCDSLRYKCVSALDCAFKLFQVFSLEYPIQSKAVWQFIQKIIYNINTSYDDGFIYYIYY